MEEEPVLNVPETSQDMNFIEGSEPKVEKHENPFQTEVFDEKSSAADEVKEELTDSSVEEEKKANNEDFDSLIFLILSLLTVKLLLQLLRQRLLKINK